MDIAPITIHIVSRVTLHLAHHMAHQFQRGINAKSVEEFQEQIGIKFHEPRKKGFLKEDY